MKSLLRASLVSACATAAALACSSNVDLEPTGLDTSRGAQQPFGSGGTTSAPLAANGGTRSAAPPSSAAAPSPATTESGGSALAGAPGTGAMSCGDAGGCVATDPCANSGGQAGADLDQDGTPDACDRCPGVPQDDLADVDRDGIPDACDRCGISVALALAPLFYFPLDEAAFEGDAANLGSAAQSAQYVGPVTRNLIGVADPNGRAVNLLGQLNGQFSSITLVNVREFPSTALTAMFWLRTSQTTTYSVVSYGLADSLNELGLIFEGANIRVTLNSSAFITTGVDAQALADGGWHHVAFSWQQASGQFYFDGVAAGAPLPTVAGSEETGGRSIPVTGPLALRPGGVLVLGQEQDTLNGGFDVAQALLGGLDEFALYDRALTAAEIRSVFDTTTCGERCDGADNDGDGRTDEAFLGSGTACAAASCQAISDAGHAFGTGQYYLSSSPGVPMTCTF